MVDIIEIASHNGVVMEQINGQNNDGAFIAGYGIKVNGVAKDYAIADDTRGWETCRYSFACIARIYNNLVPDEAAIPTF